MKTPFITLLLFTILSFPAVAWESAGKWVEHTAEPDGKFLFQPVTFELPDYITTPPRSKVPKWYHWASGGRELGDYFQVLFGAHDAGILRTTEPSLGHQSTDEEKNEKLRKRLLTRLKRQPKRYKIVDGRFTVASGSTGVLFVEHKEDLQKSPAGSVDEYVYHLVVFDKGEKFNVTVKLSSQDFATKKKILNRFLKSISLS